MTELLTPRLHCSQLKQEDWSFFLALQRDPQVMLYIADSRPLSEIREAFDSRISPWSPGAKQWLCLVVRDRETRIPLGRGYGYESLRALCDFAFSAGGVRRLTATVTAGNIASRNLLQKTGFLQEGELRECYWLNGRWHNDWLFGLLRRDYHTLKI
ncbi:GNAT family N-acetyltransferase [Raoultella ornithinolytica]|uniref:GNAT family N-acetyltransferase n=1 Tax=Raoultella ornithinolytica TaxID=54291 RepID=UPI0038AD22A6